MNKLKTIRIIISSIIFVLFIFMFLGILPYNFLLSHWLVYFQFIPAFINVFFNHSFFIILFLLVLLTFLFGRIYCSTLCPFGTLQDIFIFLRYKFGKNKFFIQQKNYKVFRYVFVLILLILFFAGNITFLSIFEPYSNFGRITNEIIKSVAYFINNILASLSQKSGFYFIKKANTHGFYPGSFIYAFFVLIVIGILSFFKGRFFCNTLCPAGAILGIISKFSVFKINISPEKCKSCGLCAGVCKAGCIDYEKQTIDNEMCINCFNCIDLCKKGDLQYTYSIKKDKTNYERRVFINKTLLGLFMFFITTTPIKLLANSIIIKKKNPIVLPPGANDIKNFNTRCISCHLCVASCPTKVLVPTTSEYGLKNFLQPKMDYMQAYCLYDCNICSRVCPTGAIHPVSVIQKKKIQIGIAKFEMKNCVVYEKETECGMCNEYCPTKAVILRPYKNGLGIPFVRENICIGCGACENVCPAKPNKAIYVEGNEKHKMAAMPRGGGRQQRKRTGVDEFPF